MRMLFHAPALALAVAAAATGSAAAAVAPPPSPAWIEMTATGAEARLVTAASVCPPIRVDGRPRPTRQRAAPDAAFPNRVCVAPLRATDRLVEAGGLSLKAPRPAPQRIVVLGDSGCRLKGDNFQNCRDPGAWPFARIAALAAARRPDLVIHVGDYYYRETPCPPGDAGCAGSPFGDRWGTWKAELFDPAAPLLAAAPWVFVRGNHEDCKRGGAGWFRQLDAAPAVKTCPADSDTYAVPLGGLTLYVVDSNDTEDFTAPSDKVARFAARLSAVKPGAGDAWIVTHRPVWDSSRLGDLLADGMVNATERAAVEGRDLSGVDLVLSGHVHNFTSLGFGPRRPAQLVVGTGGDTLDFADATPPAKGTARVDGLPAEVLTMGRFGYFVFDRQGDDWIGHFYDTRDRVAVVCRLHRRDLACHPSSG